MSEWRTRQETALTLQQYRQLEADGKLTRPLTDAPLGSHTKAKRAQDAINSQLVTTNDGYTPTRLHAPQPDQAAPHGHGTNRGYARHLRNGEDACPACKAARSAYEHARRQARKAAEGQRCPTSESRTDVH